MKQYSIFDIIGPDMIGPSSSHTAGAAKIGYMALKIFGMPIHKVLFELHGSFAQTYQGHGTDKALLAGILGIKRESSVIHCRDERIAIYERMLPSFCLYGTLYV
jgi:L-serine dehydratase